MLTGFKFETCLDRYLQTMRVDNYSSETVKQRQHACSKFITWCHKNGLASPNDVTRQTIESFKEYLYKYRKPNGEPLLVNSQIKTLSHVFLYMRWLSRNNYIVYNPAADVDFPREERRLPRNILTEAEIKRIIAQPDTNTSVGIRDRAIIEVLYSTGIRRRELMGLSLYDVDENRGTAFIRSGKGKKDRVVPIGKRAIKWLEKYLVVRSEFRPKARTKALFITAYGFPFDPDRISYVVSKYIRDAGVEKSGSCHLFRHSMATHMLENGADIRSLQEMLGHAKLETTQVYTHISIGRLCKVHSKTHPSEKARSS